MLYEIQANCFGAVLGAPSIERGRVKSNKCSNLPPPLHTRTHSDPYQRAHSTKRLSALCAIESRSPVATLLINEREFI